MKEILHIPSSNGEVELNVQLWKPEGEIKAIVQIVHGMAEYVDRYDAFASFLAENACLVIGHDQLGHGKSLATKEDLGFIDLKKGLTFLLDDIHLLRKKYSLAYPGVPYFILGHSMGSSLLRQYIQTLGKNLDGVILSGVVAKQPQILLSVVASLCRLMARVRGDHAQSQLVNSLALGSYNRRISNPQTDADWLSHDAENNLAYSQDPLCGFCFTVSAYHAVFRNLIAAQSQQGIARIDRKLPLLILSGGQDPVGGYGKAAKELLATYQSISLDDVAMKLYPHDRHEILNELDKQVVWEDIWSWVLQHTSKSLGNLE